MAQWDGKWVTNDTLKGTKIKLTNEEYLRSENQAGGGTVDLLKANASDQAEFGAAPVYSAAASAFTADDMLVNRAYVLNVLSGVRDPKDAVKYATTQNINLASAPASIDGLAAANGDRILVKDQTLGQENGIYVYNGAAAAMTRAEDANDNSDPNQQEVTSGMSCLVTHGSTNARKLYVLTTVGTITLDTTPLVFAQAPNPANFLVPKNEVKTLAALDISNGYVDLMNEAEAESIIVTPIGGPQQEYLVDFTVSVVSNVTRITFAGGDPTSLVNNVAIGDKLQIKYSYATA